MARSLGRPEGEVGRAVGEMLNRVNANITTIVYQRLRLQRGDRVLEIGFGNGKLLPALLAGAADLSYVGVDISETMVADAGVFNAALVASGRASFQLARAETLPFTDKSFEKVFAVNVIYFWPEPVRALAEMRRVLRPGGVSIVAAVSADTGEPPPFARAEFGFHRRDRETLEALHREAGFGQVELEDYQDLTSRPYGTVWMRHYSIVVASP
jgi:ubiquinone/menaquinone biosynthesis C-methylase UbiE